MDQLTVERAENGFIVHTSKIEGDMMRVVGPAPTTNVFENEEKFFEFFKKWADDTGPIKQDGLF